MLNQRRLGTAKSVSKRSQMYKLNKSYLDAVLEDYPDIKKEIYRQARERQIGMIQLRL